MTDTERIQSMKKIIHLLSTNYWSNSEVFFIASVCFVVGFMVGALVQQAMNRVRQ